MICPSDSIPSCIACVCTVSLYSSTSQITFVGLVVGLIRHLFDFDAVILDQRTSNHNLVLCCSFVSFSISIFLFPDSLRHSRDLTAF